MMKNYIILGLLFYALFSCTKDDIPTYEGKRFLYIPDSLGMDTALVSFKHYFGENTIRVPFCVRLTGTQCEEDMTYRIEVVDSLTSALPEEYELPESPVFSAGKWTDTLWISLKNTDRLQTETARLVIHLLANENFGVGFADRLTASLKFNNQMSRPAWWDKDITRNYLGAYSEEKFLAFYACTGISDLTGYEAWEKRQFVLEFREYIEERHLTEKDGSPMTVVAY